MIDTNIGQWCTNENQQIDLIKIFKKNKKKKN